MKTMIVILALSLLMGVTAATAAQPAAVPPNLATAAQPAAVPPRPAQPATQPADTLLPDLRSPGQSMTMVQWVLLLTVLAVAPAIVVMVTSFTRIVVVLGLLRQALATQQLPPNQVLFGLALLMTLVVMSPVIADVHRDALGPFLDGRLSRDDAFAAAQARVRTFMIGQVEAAGNTQDVYLFLDENTAARKDLKWSAVPTLSLIPAYVISELKIAFYMGFRIFLPFLVVDLLVASVLTSMGMLMLPPVLVSLPLKLLLFVLADGWHLVAGTLMQSFT